MNRSFVLYSWHDVVVEAKIDIPTESIIAIVKYNCHGDEFLAVKTTNGIFKYGWFLNRRGYPDYKEMVKFPEFSMKYGNFIKLPELYYPEDNSCKASNEICSRSESLEKWGSDRDSYSWGHNHYYYTCTDSAQKAFDWYYDDIKEVYDGKKDIWGSPYGHTYHCDYTNMVTHFLTEHDILTDENLKKLEDLKKFWRIGEIDGSAGIATCGNIIVGDSINWVWLRGKLVKIKKLKIKKFIEFF